MRFVSSRPPRSARAARVRTAILAAAVAAGFAAAAPSMPAAASESATAPKDALRSLRDASRAADSSALLVWQDGRYLIEDYDAAGAKPVSIQSITKSVVSLAIGKLVADGKIASIDDPVSKYLPEFTGDGRESITLRQVLVHTSGLEAGDNFGLDVENAYSMLAAAIATKPTARPGLLFRYDNRAWQLVCGVFRSAAGEDVQDYLRREVFAPLGIDRFEWDRDRSGATVCHASLALLPRDLVKIGQLVLDRGRFGDRQVIPARWFDIALPLRQSAPLPGGSGIWWQNVEIDEHSGRARVDADSLAAMVAHGLSRDTAEKVRAMDGKPVSAFYDMYIAFGPEVQRNYHDARIAATEAGMTRPAVLLEGDVIDVLATGGGGQFLDIDLRKRRIAVRLIDPGKVDGKRTTMGTEFMRLLGELP